MAISRRHAAGLALVAGVVGCTTLHPRQGWIPSGDIAAVQVHGATLESRNIKGELIAVGEDSVFVLTDEGLEGVRFRRFSGFKLSYMDRAKGRVRLGSTRNHATLMRFARFPQGFPDGFDRSSLRRADTGNAPDSTQHPSATHRDTLGGG